jgi:16S rRNA (uracil1498-N3)-methyltransferase
MNLLLLSPEEAATQPVILTDRRATHIIEVLRARVGDTLRAGVLDGPTGTATVLAIAPDRVTLQATLDTEAPDRPEDTLLLAVPRPVVLQRCLATAAALGFGCIVLFRSWGVEKSHLGAGVMQPERTREFVIEGLSQARRTHVPSVHVFPRFRPLVEDALDDLLPPGPRFVAHPDAECDIADSRVTHDQPFTVALGPERGFNEFEIGLFAGHGFAPVHTGHHPLRVETALAVLTGQLHLLRKS